MITIIIDNEVEIRVYPHKKTYDVYNFRTPTFTPKPISDVVNECIDALIGRGYSYEQGVLV